MPTFTLFGGPNGAGKTTAALQVLPALGCKQFINADLIAQGLSPLDADSAAFTAGKLMLQKLRELGERDVDFGTESTLSSRTYIPQIQHWRRCGYEIHLFYVWLPCAEMAVERVKARVRAGGHNIPEDTIRRRYDAGRRHFVDSYRPLADRWTVLDNSTLEYRLVAQGEGAIQKVVIEEVWQQIHAGL